jgi:hypothetical protein
MAARFSPNPELGTENSKLQKNCNISVLLGLRWGIAKTGVVGI